MKLWGIHFLFKALIILLLICVIYLLWLPPGQSNDDGIVQIQDWHYKWENIDEFEFVWLQKKLEKCPLNTVFVPQYGASEPFEVFIDQKKIYASGELRPAFINRHLYLKWHMINLPPKCEGKTLRFRVYGGHYHPIGITNVYLGKSVAIVRSKILRDLDITILAFIFLLMGAFAGAFFISYYRAKNYAILAFTLMAYFSGLYILTESHVTQLLFDNPIFLSYIHFVSFGIFTASIISFSGQTIGSRYRFFIQPAWIFEICFFAIALLLDLGGLVFIGTSFLLGMLLVCLIIIAVVAVLIKEAFYRNMEARIVCLGFCALGVTGLSDMILGLWNIIQRSSYPWGLFIMIICLSWVLVLRYKEERQKSEEAIAEERRRIAREIHDGLAQELALMHMKTSMWEHILDQRPKMQKEIRLFQKLLKRGMREVRRCIFALRTVDLEELGLEDALGRLTKDFGQLYDININLDIVGAFTFANELELTVFRIVQEALNNVSKHAHAKNVFIRLEFLAKQLLLIIEDDGVGFDVNAVPEVSLGQHLGLKQMRERVHNSNGTLTLDSCPGRGTVITINLPGNI